MSTFHTFFGQGFNHIFDFGALDHILFLFAICAIYEVKDWKKIVWIITSFTLAHSLTLALAILNVVNVPQNITEFLIAITILFTCIENMFIPKLHRYRILLSGFFGLIHGLGFSGLLKQLFMGMDLNLWNTLLPFNLGIEIGQLFIIGIVFILFYLVKKYTNITQKQKIFAISIPTALLAIYWLWERNIFST